MADKMLETVVPTFARVICPCFIKFCCLMYVPYISQEARWGAPEAEATIILLLNAKHLFFVSVCIESANPRSGRDATFPESGDKNPCIRVWELSDVRTALCMACS